MRVEMIKKKFLNERTLDFRCGGLDLFFLNTQKGMKLYLNGPN